MNKLTEMLPPILREYREINIIHEAILPELIQLKNERKEIEDAQFIFTCPLKYIDRWEKSLKIENGDLYDLETRRINCYNRKNNTLPYSRKKINNRIYALVPKEYCEIKWGKNWIKVRIKYEYENMMKYIYTLLDDVLPLNMVIYVDIKKTTHEMLEVYKHKELEPYTHEELETKEV